MRKQSIESVAASSPIWETLEAFARQSVQEVLQWMWDGPDLRHADEE